MQLANDEERNHPVGAKLIRNNFYVDDLLANFDSLEEARQGIESINNLTNTGNFCLRKWASNNVEAIDQIKMEDRLNKTEINLSDEKAGSIKTLGVKWNITTDELCINIKIPVANKKLTKRQALSVCAQVFDPLGILAPVTVSLKMIIQEIWKTDLGWDDEVPDILKDKWLLLQTQINILQNIKVPRWIGIPGEIPNALIGFADASKEAYGAVIYQQTGNTLNDWN